MSADPGLRGIRRLARLLRRREVSALELARTALERLGDEGMRDRSVAQLTSDIAEKQARRADRQLRDGTAGPLCGIPYGLKDLLAVRGTKTTWGAEPYRDQVLDHDAAAFERLSAAGAVLVAKLAMVTFAGAGAFRSPGASLQGATRNPWDRTRWAGGSSTGPGAAVAAGLVAFALGSETTGSIIIPASFCGVSGLRPSFGIVSRYGVMPLSWSFDKIGPLAMDAHDCGTVLAAIGGRDARDETTEDWEYRPSRQRRLTIGVLPFDGTRYPDVAKAYENAVRTLRGPGVLLKKVTLPDYPYRQVGRPIQDAETAAAHAEFIQSPRLAELRDSAQRERLRDALKTTGAEYVRATQERLRIVRALDDVFRTVDLLVNPTVPTEACSLDYDLDNWRAHFHWGILGALAGLPAISVPMGFGAAGLPLGLCFIGRRREDAVVIKAAELFQKKTDWHMRYPPPPDGAS